MPSEQKTLAFIWRDDFGADIALRLARNGYQVRCHSLADARTASDVEGIYQAQSVADAVVGATTILTLLGTPANSEELYLGGSGLLSLSTPGNCYVDLTTANPRQARELHALLAVHDCLFVDAPIMGGLRSLEKGELEIFAGGEPDALDMAHDVLAAISSKVNEFELPGNGAAAKLMRSVSLAGSMMSVVESLAFAKDCGLNDNQRLALIDADPAISARSAQHGQRVISEDFGANGDLARFYVDLSVAYDVATELEIAYPTLEAAHQLMDLLIVSGGGEMDLEALALIYRDEGFCKEQGLDWELAQRMMDLYDPDGMYYDDDCDDPDCDHDHGNDYGHRHHHNGEPPAIGGYFSSN